jgi:hypothetical protein
VGRQDCTHQALARLLGRAFQGRVSTI